MSNALEASLVAAGITAREHLPRGTYLSINVSPGALVSSEVRAVLDAAPGGLEQLVFELTEQNGVEDYDGLATALDGVRAAGGHVAVEDAGAGYDSLQHVLRLRPEYVKLDRGLISDAHADPAKLAIIEAVGLFAGRLGRRAGRPGHRAPRRAGDARRARRPARPGLPLRSPRPLARCATCRSPACAR